MGEPDANGWMPIETAPRDGSVFIVWLPEIGKEGVCDYAEAGDGSPASFRYGWLDIDKIADQGGPKPRPTLWRPLQKPPLSTSHQPTQGEAS